MHNKEIISFKPTGKTFQFQMNDCFKQQHGYCPIQERLDVNCTYNKLLSELKKTEYNITYLHPEIIYYPKCNHYSCNNGQHRVCVLGKLGKTIDTTYNVDSIWEKCYECIKFRFDINDDSFFESF